jgi:hypothetical protein
VTLQSEIHEYNSLCNNLETEVASLLSPSAQCKSSVTACVWVLSLACRTKLLSTAAPEAPSRMDIDQVYSKVRMSIDSFERKLGDDERPREAFWRELSQTEDKYETVTRFFAKGVVH